MSRPMHKPQSAIFDNPFKVAPSAETQARCVSVVEAYERWAPIYDYTPNPLLSLEERHLKCFLPDLSGKHVLDLACGTGRWLARILAMGAQTGVGVDLSGAMLRVASGRYKIRGRLALADCSHLPFGVGVFDCALCSFALNHIKDLAAMAHELARVVKCGGQLLLCELHPEAYARGWRAGFRDVRGAVQVETVFHSANNVVKSFQSNGLVCEKMHTLFFSEPERRIFIEAGKEEVFEEACRVPAIQVYSFNRP